MRHSMRRFSQLMAVATLSTAVFVTGSGAAGATTLDIDDLFTPLPRATVPQSPPFNPDITSALRDVLQDGQQALLSGDFDRAELLAGQVTTLAPEAAEGWHLLGLARINLGDAEGAVGALGRAGALYEFNAEPYVVQGDILLSVGDLEAARDAFARAIAQDPENWHAHHGLAKALGRGGDAEGARAALADAVAALEPAAEGALGPRIELAQAIALNGDVEAALTLLSEFAAAHPADAEALLMLGRMQIVADAYDDAAHTLARAAALAENPVPALLAQATADERRGETGAALTALMAARDVVPDEPLIHIRLGEVASVAEDAEGAITHFEDAVAMAGGGPLAGVARLRLANAYLSAGRPAEVAETLEPLGAAADDDTARTLRARAALAQGDTETARAALDGAPTAEPAVGVADLLVEEQDFAFALQILEDARVAYPDAVEPLARLGRLYGALRRYDDGLAAFEQALALAPGRPDLERGAMLIAHRTGDTAAARVRAERLAAADNPEAQDLVWLGSFAETEGDTVAALAAYERAVALQPTNWVALNNLASLVTTETPGRAAALAAQAADLAPDVPQVRHTLGWALYLSGDLDAAETVYRALIEAEPEEARTAYRLGRILMDSGAQEEGLAELRRAIALDVDFEGADVTRNILAAP